jgi:hypothetical protein
MSSIKSPAKARLRNTGIGAKDTSSIDVSDLGNSDRAPRPLPPLCAGGVVVVTPTMVVVVGPAVLGAAGPAMVAGVGPAVPGVVVVEVVSPGITENLSVRLHDLPVARQLA